MSTFINLQLGWPSPSLFPAPQLLNGASKVLQSEQKAAGALIYGPDAGYAPLRQSIAAWLSSCYFTSQPISAERICVTNGASASLHNILSKFTEPGYTHRIWMVEPCYFLACPIFTDNGFEGRLRGVPEDDQGLDIEFLRRELRKIEQDPTQPSTPSLKTSPRYKLYKHIIYAVPTFSNPSGKTMSLRRRHQLVRLAREFDALVVTDDVYDVLRWPEDEDETQCRLGAIPPRIVDVDRFLDDGPRSEWGNAISNGSFSKIVAPGVRTGWVEGTPKLALYLSELGAYKSGGCPSHLTATFIEEMLSSGQLQAHIKDTLIPTYRSRYYVLRNAVRDLLEPLGFKTSMGTTYGEVLDPSSQSNGVSHGTVAVAGGFFVYVTIPNDLPVSSAELSALASEKSSLKFASGSMMAVEGDKGSIQRGDQAYSKGIRLCWAWHSENEIYEGIERLTTLVKGLKSVDG
ncbi:related to aromatic amino acid aminotransferase and related proteins [Fusarium mangiferae]|uniref:Related to aromatic amino acid aminotransferase and related proteins n=1 Tax=Fusarium mangiferae TaxID=192010 RepID=A0A1L7TCY3_FUSMA|nr:related to aromatic amino acid aminotransferase and related proteins [Fusarium mangiferae]CVK96548.1 related to aromatic amino acid aminotransferase and related proteins [Fusarium mangiferae]